MQYKTATVDGRNLKVGDSIEFLGKFYTIDRFEPHPGLVDCYGQHHPIRVAVSERDGFRIAVPDDDPFRVKRKETDHTFSDFLRQLLAN